MMLRLLVVTSLLCVLTSAVEQLDVSQRKSYEGYQVVEIIPKNDEEVKYLRDLMVSTDYLDFWTEPSYVGKEVTIMVSPTGFVRLQVALRKNDIKFVKTIENLQTLVQPEWDAIDQRAKNGMVFNIDDFNTLADINAWLGDLRTRCRAGLTCEVYSVGNSHNGNPIQVFKMSRPGANRRGYWIDAGIHAREWISPATVLKVLDGLARGTSANAIRLTDDFDWYIMPVMNPDGYAYTWTNERMWRKNRRPNAGSNCFGTDLNRNFNFRWGREGVSHQPCGETYCGPSGGSEPETQRVQAELVRLGPSLLGMVTVHSYGNMWMFPWGNTVNHNGGACDLASDHTELMRVSNLIADAVQTTYATRWSRGNSCVVIYTTTGGTDDYAKGVAGIKYSFCPELRGTNFIIAASQIQNSYNEFWNGIVAMVAAIPLT